MVAEDAVDSAEGKAIGDEEVIHGALMVLARASGEEQEAMVKAVVAVGAVEGFVAIAAGFVDVGAVGADPIEKAFKAGEDTWGFDVETRGAGEVFMPGLYRGLGGF
jgi:hypothetical protein